MEYKFKLFKIHCAGCAVALEQIINQIPGVKAELNFVTKVLKLSIETQSPADTLTEVKLAISTFDSAIEISDYEDSEDIEKREKLERKLKITRLITAFAILIINFFITINWLQITIYVLDYLLISYRVLISAGKNILRGKIFDENFLMVVASIGALCISEFVEGVFVMLLYEVGEILENFATSKSRRTISALLEVKQNYANLVTDEAEFQVSLAEVDVGNIIRIKPGEKVPLDSVVIEGTSYLDMSALTGESKEKVVTVGDHILSGAINGSSVLLAKVEKIEAESTISKVVELVEKATETKAKSEKFISKFSRVYTPTVIVLALLIMFIPPIFSGYSNFSTYVYRGLCFLVVSCPCALVISVPLSYFAGIGSFARVGIIVKGATFIEALSKVDAVVFDKTGTLTEGNFEITEIVAFGDHTKEEILETTAYAENFSNHKIAKSIVEKYKEQSGGKEINVAWINEYEEIAGKGIKANIFMQETFVGTAKFLNENGITAYEISGSASVVYVGVAGEFVGYIAIEDSIKKDSALAISELKKLGIKDISMCTGDTEAPAKSISAKLGIKKCHHNLLPEDKVDIIINKVQEGKTVAFVGDGINDAPSLANANVGIVMGGVGSDVAVQASDVIIMNDEPSKVAVSIKKAKKTHRIVIENIIGSIGIKVLVLLLIGFGLSEMWLAVFADVGVNLLACLNSLRAMLK